jgi:putative hydrolase of the HAD superfamily
MAEVLDLFDVIVESSRVGVRKPDARFYEIACELLDIEPADAVFLDDLGVNLKPARELGMTTIKVGDPQVAIAELETVVGFSLTGE